MHTAPTTQRFPWWLVAVAVVLWAAKYHPFLDAPRVIDDDARQHVYWTYTFQDPELFRNDLLTALFSSTKLAPPGYQALYAVGARLMDPLLFSQVLALLLLVGSAWLLWRLGQVLGGGKGGNALAVVLFLLYFLYSTSGGLPKSFAFPLLLAGVYLIQRHAFHGVAGVLLVQGLLYPPMLVNTLALVAVSWWRAWRGGMSANPWKNLVILGLGASLAAGSLLGVYALTPRPALEKLITPTEARTMAEFSAQGRTAFYGKTLLQTMLNDRAGLGAERLYGFVGIIGLMALVRWPVRLTVPVIVQDMVWTSLVLFLVAHAVLFRLHLPSRYVLYTLPLAALLVIAVNGAATYARMKARWPSLQCSARWLNEHRAFSWVTISLSMVAFVYIQNQYIVSADPLTVRIDATALRVYRHLQTLPKDVLLAGHPFEMDNVPLFARRKVLVNQELSIPYYTGYYAEVRQRLTDSLLAYYAHEAQPVQHLVERYGVDYILLNTQHFTPQFLGGRLYYEPFNSIVRQTLTADKPFVLLQQEVGQHAYTHGPYILVSVAHLKKGSDGRPQP